MLKIHIDKFYEGNLWVRKEFLFCAFFHAKCDWYYWADNAQLWGGKQWKHSHFMAHLVMMYKFVSPIYDDFMSGTLSRYGLWQAGWNIWPNSFFYYFKPFYKPEILHTFFYNPNSREAAHWLNYRASYYGWMWKRAIKLHGRNWVRKWLPDAKGIHTATYDKNGPVRPPNPPKPNKIKG